MRWSMLVDGCLILLLQPILVSQLFILTVTEIPIQLLEVLFMASIWRVIISILKVGIIIQSSDRSLVQLLLQLQLTMQRLHWKLSPRAHWRNNQLWDNLFFPVSCSKMRQKTLSRVNRSSKIRSIETQLCLRTSSMITMKTNTCRLLKSISLISKPKSGQLI